ncbi:MAG: transcription antitermination factor NusB [Nocardioidaceae bacterium]
MTRAARRAQPRTALDAARQTAYDALRSVDQDDAYLNLMLPRLLFERGLSGRDAGLATELANGTARLQGSYDAFLDSCVTGGITNVQPAVLTALRLGVHQLLSMRVPAHAAVGTSVELVRTAVGERPVRLVNAVLRKVATKTYDEWVEATAPARSNDLVGHLAVRHSHPRWIVQAYLDVLSDLDAVEALLIADNVAPTVTLASRPGLCSIDELCAADATPSKGLADGTQKAVITPARWSPYAAQLSGGTQPSWRWFERAGPESRTRGRSWRRWLLAGSR